MYYLLGLVLSPWSMPDTMHFSSLSSCTMYVGVP